MFPFQTGKKVDVLQSFVRAELDGAFLGESDKKAVNPVEQRVDFEYNCKFQWPNNARALSNIAQKPVICKLMFENRKFNSDICSLMIKINPNDYFCTYPVCRVDPFLMGKAFSCGQ